MYSPCLVTTLHSGRRHTYLQDGPLLRYTVLLVPPCSAETILTLKNGESIHFSKSAYLLYVC